MQLFDTPTQILLNKAMDASSLRQKVIADNLANISTPRFKRSEVVFAEQLQKALRQDYAKNIELKISDKRHFQISTGNQDWAAVSPEIVQINDLNYRNDENNVDIDVEMAQLAKNKINYDLLTHCMNNEMKLIKMAIKGGI